MRPPPDGFGTGEGSRPEGRSVQDSRTGEDAGECGSLPTVHTAGIVSISSRVIAPKSDGVNDRTTFSLSVARRSAAKAVRGTTNDLRRVAIRNPLERLAYGES